jgi:hypothetical protein
MALFTGAYPDPLAASPHAGMQTALLTARQGLSAIGTPNVDRLAIIAVALTGFAGTNNHPWAAIRDTEFHYSASLLKVAAMYAAFDLRSSADQLASAGGHTSWDTLEPALQQQFDPDIAARTPSLITSSGTLRPQDKSRKPNYRAVLDVTNGPVWRVDFSAVQVAAFEDMLVQQNNPGATTTIHGLGYPYLNGKIADDGFFSGGAGMWLAGDYAGGTDWPAARIDSVNDGPVAQATTARHLARMFTLLFTNRLVGRQSSLDMQDLLGRAGKWFHWDEVFAPIWPPGSRFVATHSKVGNGPMKIASLIALSEAVKITDTLTGKDFVVVWQNVQDTTDSHGSPLRRSFEPVAQLVEATLSAFF